jgi:hypothetical protein
MKAFAIFAKILAALATVIGAVYLLATYGDQIVAWCKNLIDSLPEISCFDPDEDDDEDEDEDPVVVEVVEDAADEVPVEEIIEDVVEDVADAAKEIADAVVADEADFEG